MSLYKGKDWVDYIGTPKEMAHTIIDLAEEIAAARAALAAANDFFHLRKTSHDGDEIHGAALAYYALRETYDKVRGKGS